MAFNQMMSEKCSDAYGWRAALFLSSEPVLSPLRSMETVLLHVPLVHHERNRE